MQAHPSAHGRRIERLSATIPMSLLRESDNPKIEYDAYTVDLSRNGMRVRTTIVLYPGELLEIGDSVQSIPSRVVWVERSSVHGSLAGLEFLEN